MAESKTKNRRGVRAEVITDEPPIIRVPFQPQGIRLKPDEIQAAYGRDYPPILTLDEAAQIARCSPSTLKTRFSRGEFAACVKRGKPLRIWRNRFVEELMRG